MCYIVPGIYIVRRFLKDGYCSQQFIPAVAKDALVLYNLTQNTSNKNTFDTVTPNATPNQVKQV